MGPGGGGEGLAAAVSPSVLASSPAPILMRSPRVCSSLVWLGLRDSWCDTFRLYEPGQMDTFMNANHCNEFKMAASPS